MGSNLGRSAAQAAGLVYSLPFLPHFRFRRGRRPGGQMDGGEPAARGKSAVGTGREKVVEMNKATKLGRGWGTGQTRKREAQVGRQRDDRPPLPGWFRLRLAYQLGNYHGASLVEIKLRKIINKQIRIR